ncbi:MAG TPA: MBL fold metallo-hydrolase [Gammaproteobacteria bacterium]|nr:MBL fold metallo-hydrolase [Gammaproteobacteria bacterium]
MRHDTHGPGVLGRRWALLSIAVLGLGTSAAQSQLTVDAFPALEPTDFSYVSADRIAAFRDETRQKSVRPFEIFDNLYYIGIEWVASYLLVTSDGLIVIDSLHEPYVETGIEHIRELGFEPTDVRYVLGTHGHFDHVGGHAHYQKAMGSRVGMTAADWKRAQADAAQPTFGMELAEVDLVIQDGDTLELGDQTMRFYVTPGHTEGVLSMEFSVRDGNDRHRAVIFGGSGSLTNDFWRYQTVLGNLRRFKVVAAQSPPITVRLTAHPSGPGAGSGPGLFELRDSLRARGPGDPHPFVEPPGAFIESLEQSERAIERAILALP